MESIHYVSPRTGESDAELLERLLVIYQAAMRNLGPGAAYLPRDDDRSFPFPR